MVVGNKKKGKKTKKKVKGKRKEVEKEFHDVMPKGIEERAEGYMDKIPEEIVKKYEKYLNMHMEDDELARNYPDEIERSVRVLPRNVEGECVLCVISTDEKKVEDLRRFLKGGKFEFDSEFIDGVERERVEEEIEVEDLEMGKCIVG